jgi:DNA-binding transcriptional MocR family regulator
MEISRTSKTPVYLQIVNHYEESIVSGRLLHGFHIPSERTLAKELGVNRNTVARVYETLKDDGYIALGADRRYTVHYPEAASPPESGSPDARRASRLVWESCINERYLTPEHIYDRIIEQAISRNYINFATEYASPDIYPVETLAELTRSAACKLNDENLGYTPTQGLPELRAEICGMLRSRNIYAMPYEVQIFSETSQALNYIIRLLLSEGDRVIMEEPVYTDAYLAIKNAGGKIVTAPTDENGIRTELLDALIAQHRPRFLFLIPTFNNPTKSILPLARRRELLDIVYRHHIPVVEEDSMYETRLSGSRLPPLKALDDRGHVVYLDSFCDTCSPGLRISYAVAPKEMIRRLKAQLTRDGLQPDTISQLIIAEFLSGGYYRENLGRVAGIYRKKLSLMLEMLRGSEDVLRFSVPQGSVALWCRIPDRLDTIALLKATRRKGVIFMPGDVYFPRGSGDLRYIRLGFGYPAEAEIRRGIPILIDEIRKLSAHPLPAGQNAVDC